MDAPKTRLIRWNLGISMGTSEISLFGERLNPIVG